MIQTEEKQDIPKENLAEIDSDQCFCEKKVCAIGIASVAIGIGGLILATLI